ncbi:MAG TPA: 6-pyruvoyl tetrahydrobiopterin synthase [Planctomycetaceae bacterium]|nr:6-pyruvoyl tetrahydrobiopterin synthase [Blastopirellula sp.]HAY78759.1 6-pyruvoyl tetrahydrobiopterin synthase [Planctomycetaceae bacterium]
MSETYHVRLDKERFVFSAAHFITFDGNVCERLHGHNYRVFAEFFGELDENQYVVDFIALRDELVEIIDSLDHRMLLPDSHPTIRVAQKENEFEVTFEDRRWVFPVGDCVVLPVENTTAEKLARYIGMQLLTRLETRLGHRPTQIKIGVDENHGQWGICELTNE